MKGKFPWKPLCRGGGGSETLKSGIKQVDKVKFPLSRDNEDDVAFALRRH